MLLFLCLYYQVILLIPVVISQIFNQIAELVIPIRIASKKAKAEMETHLVIVEITVSEWST